MHFNIQSLFLLSFLFRLGLVLYGEWQDRYFAVKFTDIDYHVFSDAAKHVTAGESPFMRPTYRYTPLLAVLLTPNHYLFFSFGKILFILCDLVAGWLIYVILSLKGVTEPLKLLSCSLWLLNPLTATVSSRGNAESLLSVLVLLCLYCIMCKHIVLSGIAFGLAVHMKIFPIVYSLPLFLFLDCNYHSCDVVHLTGIRKVVRQVFNLQRLKFTSVSAMTFVVITVSLYALYGQEFIQEAYLYHVTRRDTRHNFSVYFYMLYLIQDSWLSFPVGIVAFLPQAVLLLTASLCLYRDIPFCCFVQTFIFVTFNKVCTSQYFLWYLCLLPLLLPFSRLSLPTAVTVTVLWFLGQGLWLAPAYFLEFQGYNTLFLIWLAGLVFFGINTCILVKIIRNHNFVPTFISNKITTTYKHNVHYKTE